METNEKLIILDSDLIHQVQDIMVNKLNNKDQELLKVFYYWKESNYQNTDNLPYIEWWNNISKNDEELIKRITKSIIYRNWIDIEYEFNSVDKIAEFVIKSILKS